MYSIKMIFDDILMFLTALLKHNLHMTKPAHRKFTIQ